jgi:serine/threonine protein phosphatase PrpC
VVPASDLQPARPRFAHPSKEPPAMNDPLQDHPMSAPPISGLRQVPARSIRVTASGLTDVGLVRRNNEDGMLVLPELGLFAVADGVGGAAAGEVASATVLEVVRDAFEDREVAMPPEALPPPEALLVAAIRLANRRVRAKVTRDASLRGMATTIAGVVVRGDRVVLAHVGDSRVYRLRGDRLEALTVDHSAASWLVAAGLFTRASVDAYGLRGFLVHAVGVDSDVLVDTRVEAAVPGDRYLISSDGLHDVVPHVIIENILRLHEDPANAVGELIEDAKRRGGPDNITAVLIRLGEALQ